MSADTGFETGLISNI